MLIAYTDKNTHVRYAYDGDRRRVSKTVGNATTVYLNDPNRTVFEVIVERDGSNNVTDTYTYGPVRLSHFKAAGNVKTFYLPDRLGSVRQVTDVSGNVVEQTQFDVFGGEVGY